MSVLGLDDFENPETVHGKSYQKSETAAKTVV